MSEPRKSHPIPAEALARRAHLLSTRQAMDLAGPSLEATPLRRLRDWLSGGVFPEPESWLSDLQAQGLAEEAQELIRSGHGKAGSPPPPAVLERLGELAGKSQERRAARRHLDTRRCPVRFRFRKQGEATGFEAGDIQTLFLDAFRLEGVSLSLDLGKRPRPELRVEFPLPAGVEGRNEVLEAVLKASPAEPWSDWMDRLNRRLPTGLALSRAEPLSIHASPASELAEASHWSWPCPEPLRNRSQEATTSFLQAGTFPWQRGEVGSAGALDLRHFITAMRWEGADLRFSTRMGPLAATNPQKVLAAVLGMAPSELPGLARLSIDLREDPRLLQAGKYEPKLRNLYEDAVLLTGGSNITLVEDDDDEPIRLG